MNRRANQGCPEFNAPKRRSLFWQYGEIPIKGVYLIQTEGCEPSLVEVLHLDITKGLAFGVFLGRSKSDKFAFAIHAQWFRWVRVDDFCKEEWRG